MAALALGFSALSPNIFLPMFFQQVQHHAAAEAGLMVLPPVMVVAFIPTFVGCWVAKVGPRVPMATGFVLVAATTFSLLAVGPDTGYPLILLVLLGVG